MTDLQDLALDIVATCVPQSLLTDADRATIVAHKDFLLGFEDQMISVFYDSLYAHAPTAAVFEDGERPAREASLRDWWQKTVNGPIDDNYLAWMALVGIIHIRRKVQNPMMLSMFSLVANSVHAAALEQLDAAEAETLRVAFSHLESTVTSVIAEAYTHSYVGALQNLAGLDPKLTDRMLQIEVKTLEQAGRDSLG